MKNKAILFAMRYDNSVGYVWNTIKSRYSKIASELDAEYDCYIAYPLVHSGHANNLASLEQTELDLYNYTPANKSKIVKFCREKNVRAIVFMSALPTSIDLPFLHRIGVATINTENDSFDHNQKQRIWKKFAKFILRRCFEMQVHTVHIANCKSQEKWLLQHAQIPRKRMRVVFNGIDVEKFIPGDREAACKKLNLSTDIKWVLCVSQARPEKRVDKIVEVAAQLAKCHEDLKVGFIYVGDGECFDKLKEQAINLDLKSNFIFAGKQDNLVDYYRIASVFVHAAERESFGNVLVEAMLCEVPVVATNAKGPSEIVVNSKTGFLVGKDDFNAFSDSIVKYISSPELGGLHGKLGRLRACELYSMEKNSKLIADIVKDAILSFKIK